MVSNFAQEVFHQSIPFKEIEPMDSGYIKQIVIDSIAKDNEYGFTTEKEIYDTDAMDSEW